MFRGEMQLIMEMFKHDDSRTESKLEESSE